MKKKILRHLHRIVLTTLAVTTIVGFTQASIAKQDLVEMTAKVKMGEVHKAKADKLEKRLEETNETLKETSDKLLEVSSFIEGLEFKPSPSPYENDGRPYDLNNILMPSNATAEQIDKHLEGTPMAGLGSTYIMAERLYGVNAYFKASLDIWESGWGKSKLARTKKNLSGYKAFNNAVHKAETFDDFKDCIYTVAGAIRTEYLTEGQEYYSGLGLQDINKHYAQLDDGSPNTEWSKGIAQLMKQLSR